MKRLNIHEAKTHLSRLVAEVKEGEQFVLCRAGKPVACLSQYHPPNRARAVSGRGLCAAATSTPRYRPTSREPFGETANEGLPSRHPRHALVALRFRPATGRTGYRNRGSHEPILRQRDCSLGDDHPEFDRTLGESVQLGAGTGVRSHLRASDCARRCAVSRGTSGWCRWPTTPQSANMTLNLFRSGRGCSQGRTVPGC